jgi:GNAT superfamily N-acetyltransferase
MKPINIRSQLKIIEVNHSIQDCAKEIILEGLEERFGFLDRSLNSDLNDIQENYINKGYVFLLGIYDSKPVCTGALIKEDKEIGRIVRMSVLKDYRRKGLAQVIISELENKAVELGFTRIVLETNKEWYDAINFYSSNGFNEYLIDERLIHMEKIIRR